MPTVTYPYDATGQSQVNLISGETQLLTEINRATYRLIVPDFAPFYLDNFKLVHRDSLGVDRILTPDVDYNLALPYIGAQRSTGKIVVGAVSINTTLVQGTLRLDYQCVGGPWIANKTYVLQRLMEIVYNPRTAIWDNITNIQEYFPPTDHNQALDDVHGYEDILTGIHSIADAIANSPNVITPIIRDLIQQYSLVNNLTPASVGLGLVQNRGEASAADMTRLLSLATDSNWTSIPVDKTVTMRSILLLKNYFDNAISAIGGGGSGGGGV